MNNLEQDAEQAMGGSSGGGNMMGGGNQQQQQGGSSNSGVDKEVNSGKWCCGEREREREIGWANNGWLLL